MANRGKRRVTVDCRDYDKHCQAAGCTKRVSDGRSDLCLKHQCEEAHKEPVERKAKTGTRRKPSDKTKRAFFYGV